MKSKIRCVLCPKGCELAPGEWGDCHVRHNVDGIIRCATYGHPCSVNIDPVEKKPLYHFLPGTPIFSIATSGCNLHCKNCQNRQISQFLHTGGKTVDPTEVTVLAQKNRCPSIAYTYTEPLVSYEYTFDCCKSAREAGLKNVLVTAAFINPDPLRRICRYVDAANVDLKSFSDDFYRDVCGARLKPVLKALKIMKACGVMLEVTNLIIPTLNDSIDETRKLCDWIIENLGIETPLHFSRFFPQNQLQHLPPTPVETLLRARQTAIDSGLLYVYVGNMSDREGESTRCPGCSRLLIERSGYHISNHLGAEGTCPDCHTRIHGIWT